MQTWTINEENINIAEEKASQLAIDYSNHGYGKKSNVISKNHSYQIGFLGEEEFRRYLIENGISHLYLNDTLNHDAKPDNGDYIINGRIANLKTQIFYSGTPDGNWLVNVNEKDFKDDQRKGFSEYHFVLYNPQSFKMFYGGYIEAHSIPYVGRLIKKNDPVTHWLTASETMYVIPLNKLRPLIPDSFQDVYTF